jgi:diguanylate cyclase (GGDEF)-like protein
VAPEQTFPVIQFLGVLVQMGGALTLLGLFLLLRGFVLRRPYFSAWMWAWAAFAVAILALGVRYVFAPGIMREPLPEDHGGVRLLYFVYQLCKLLGLSFFLRGTLMYRVGTRSAVSVRRVEWAVLGYAVLSTLASPQGLVQMLVWQAVAVVPILGYCAWTLLRLPRSRRSPGTVAAGAAFGALAALWTGYMFGFGTLALGLTPPMVADVLVNFNSYFDLGANLVLGFAMIVLLMEDARRETNDAQNEVRLSHDRLRRAAMFDPLTDTLNRRAYMEGVGLEMARGTYGTVVLADLDNLKVVNDELGHAAGDRLLRSAADILRAVLRPYDKLYRWGGDEFLVVVPSASADNVLSRLERVVEQADTAEVADGVRVKLEMSMGAADYSSAEELNFAVERADRAMYQDKARRKARRGAVGLPALEPTAR